MTSWARAFSLGAALTLAGFASASAMGAEGKAPVIVSTGWGIGGEVSANASINPGGLVTSYEIALDCGACGLAGGGLATGQLPAVQEAIGVSLNLTGIAPGTYRFHVAARNAAGEASAYGELTVPQPPPGSCPTGCGSNEQYGSEVPGWYGKLSESESVETHEKYEAEQRAKKQKEQEEQKAKEARYAEEEAAFRRREEEEAREDAARERQEEEAEHPACVVPALKGDTLTAARRALAKAHCRSGIVHRPFRPTRHHDALRVTRQGVQPGARLRRGARVALWIGAPPRRSAASCRQMRKPRSKPRRCR